MRSALKKAAGKIAHSSGLVDYLLRRKTGFLVLMYHSVHPDTRKSLYQYSVGSGDFEKQISYIRDRFDVVRLSDIVRAAADNIPADGLKIAVTFDDGYKNNITVAYPVLLRYRIPATIFLATDYIEENSDTFLGWSDINNMKKSGLVEFGVHTHRHLDLTSLAPADIENEIRLSKRIIEEKLGQPAGYFSYPFGGVNARIKNILSKNGFIAAFRDRLPGKEKDMYEIGRMSVDSDGSGPAGLAFKIAFSRSSV